MNCDTGNLSYVDKVKLIVEKINAGILDFTSENWTNENGNLNVDDNTLQKVLNKFNTFIPNSEQVNVSDDFNYFLKDVTTLKMALQKIDKIDLERVTDEQLKRITRDIITELQDPIIPQSIFNAIGQ